MVHWIAKAQKAPQLLRLVSQPQRALQLWRCLRGWQGASESDEQQLQAAMAWLSRAQDATGGGAVSYGYSLLTGWLLPYPETTGYCIPTFLDYADRIGNEEYRRRAIRMAEWEFSVQSASGGIPGGAWNSGRPAVPISFDTGQVLQGWCRLYEETGDPRFLEASIRAADWLVKAQRPEGAWEDTAPLRSRSTRFAFNTRTSWPLLDIARVTGDQAYRSAAMRNLEWTLRQQTPNGWFHGAGFSPEELPLTHTLGYVLEGLLECWQRIREPRLLDAVRKASGPLLEMYRQHTCLPAVIGPDWMPRSKFICVTGCAQISRVWFLLSDIDHDAQLRDGANGLLNQIKSWQILGAIDPGVDGAVPGSYPVYGGYEPLRFPNWGVKFFCDALLASIQAKTVSAQEVAASD